MNTVRSASPPIKFRKIGEQVEEVKGSNLASLSKKKLQRKQQFGSPQTTSRRQEGNIINSKIEESQQRIKNTKGFLDSQRINKNLNIKNPQNLLTFQSNEDLTSSAQNSPSKQAEISNLFTESH